MPDPCTYRYQVVDVFTTRQFEGNPLAVFPDASGLSDAIMPCMHLKINGEGGRDGIEVGGNVTPVGEATIALHP